MSVLIFANGELQPGKWIGPLLEKATFVIAADGGLKHVLALRLHPDVLIGDLDSVSVDLISQMNEGGTTVIKHPTDKDETDLELALNYAITKHSGDIFLLAALGGRLDQMLSNVQLLAHENFANRLVKLVDGRQSAWLVRARTSIDGKRGDTLSLIPIGGDARVASTIGLHWPLSDEVLEFGKSRGISNVMTDDRAYIAVESGILLCVHTDRGWVR
jgi:thiamine pyrophosphokinase